jgi:hypothetical protein
LASTYDPTALEDSPKDRLRAMVGDVAAPFQMTDEEYLSFYALAPGIFSAAADAADALAGKAAPESSVSLGVVGIGGGNAARYYLDLADKYRGRAALAGEGSPGTTGGVSGLGAPAATGLSLGDMAANDRDRDRPPSVFHTSQRFRTWWP